MIPSTRHQTVTAQVYRLSNEVSNIEFPRNLRDYFAPPAPLVLATPKAEEASLAVGWALIFVLGAVVLIPMGALLNAYAHPESQYQALGDIATGLLISPLSGVVLHYVRYWAVRIAQLGREQYQNPTGRARLLFASGDADVVVQALMTIVFIILRLQANP